MLATLALPLGEEARADTLFSDDGARHGHILGLDAKGVNFVEGCGGGPGAKVGWDAVDDAVFDTKCDAGGQRPTVAGSGVCATKATFRFLLYAKAGGAPVPADDVLMGEDGMVHYTDLAKQVVGHASASDLHGISYRQVCGDSITDIDPSSPVLHRADPARRQLLL